MVAAIPAYLILIWLFGAICGGIVVYAKFRYATSVADRLSGKNPEQGKPVLTSDHLYYLIIAPTILLCILAVAVPLCVYHVELIRKEERTAQHMIDSGYTYMPTQLAGWRKEDPEGVSLEKSIQDKVEEMTLKNPNYSEPRDLAPGEAFVVQEEMKKEAMGSK